MSGAVDVREFRRWQEEVARDPGSPSFLPLAEVYRREGRAEVARRLCLRGLERHPDNVEAHVLLARLYRDAGEAEKACDELDIALSLDPAHRAARRSIGYLCLERRDWAAAARHLERAAAAEPGDEKVASALALAREHARGGAVPAPTDVAELVDPLMERFVREARVRLVLLIEGSGKIVAQHGFTQELDIRAFATLGAGIQAAARALAKLVGQPAFEQLYQGEGDRQLFLGPLATPTGELILMAVFGEETTIGVVRMQFDEFAREVSAMGWSAAPPVGDGSSLESRLAAGFERARPTQPDPRS